MGIEDAPKRVIVDVTTGDQPIAPIVAYSKGVNSQGTLAAEDSGSLHGDESAPTEEELNLVSAGVLPPHYKKLVSASIRLALAHFHEIVRCCLRRNS